MPQPTQNNATSNAKNNANGYSWRKTLRIERAARLEAAGVYTASEIANVIGVTPAYYSILKSTPEFKARMIEVTTGITSQHDIDIRRDIEYQREELKDAVPMALQKLKILMLSKNDNVALKAAGEILDRQGDHVKVSKSEIKLTDKYEHSKHDALATDLFSILSGVALGQVGGAQDITGAQDEFSKGAVEAESQVILNADVITEDTLKYIDEKKLPVQ